jgi:nucleoside-diphosphate-sugar epimerase
MRVNLIGTYNALEAALATKDTIERVIEFSTSEVFGTYAYKVDEQHVTTQGSVGEARWTYAVSKLAGEHMAHAYHDELGCRPSRCRPFNVYGPGQIGGGAIRAFIETALAGKPLVIHGDGSQIRAWCYVDDMVEALLLALEHPNAVGESFNVGNARSAVTIYDLRATHQAMTGLEHDLVFQPLHYTDVRAPGPERRTRRASCSVRGEGRARRGLERTIAWYRRTTANDHAHPAARPDVGEAELARSQRSWARAAHHGPKVAEFERDRAQRRHAARAVVSPNGRAPPRVLALEIGPGDEVIVPPITFPATANVVQVVRQRAPSSSTSTRTRSTSTSRRSRPRSARDARGDGGAPLRAPGRVGGAADRRAAGGRARRGRRRRARRDATAARRAARSASRLPLVPSAQDRDHGRGRRVTTDEAPRRRRAALRHHGWATLGDMPRPGFNYRLPDLLCAIGIPQLARLEELLAARERVAGWYTERLEHHVLTPSAAEGDRHGWQAYVVSSIGRDEALRALRDAGIEAQIGTWALHRLEPYRAQGRFPGADRAFERALALPSRRRPRGRRSSGSRRC